MALNDALRNIPSVEKVVHALGDTPFGLPRQIVTAEVRHALDTIRRKIAKTPDAAASPEFESVVSDCRKAISSFALTRIAPVINGTGVLIHTNLGRSPLGPVVADRLREIATSYCNVEIDLAKGERGPRAGFLESAISALCKSESATVVNNCAAALVLILKHMASGKRNEVIVSRGELVEIGGGFRVPEILEASGARLVEVGTTNKTRADDYANAVTENTAMFLKVHRSNFSMDGFVESPTTEQLSALARKTATPFVEDLGSGSLLATEHFAPIEHEPTPSEVIAGGVDLVCFSGDKLLGGPQSGIVAGRADLVRGLKREPFYRAVRPDKLILAVLQETITEYLEFAARSDGSKPPVPVVQMLAVSTDELTQRAESMLASLPGDIRSITSIVPSTARCGGGTMPKSQIPSIALQFAVDSNKLENFSHQLRTGKPGIVGYIDNGKFHIDLRTVFPHHDATVATSVESAAKIALEQLS